MKRVSTDMMNNDMQYWLRRTESDLSSTEGRIARQKRIENLRDDPISAGHATRYASFAFRLERFEANGQRLQDAYKVGEDHARQALEVMQRVRELAVRGAQGSFTKDDMAAMAGEVDELLKELLASGNARSADGSYIFAGDKASTEPFRAIMGKAPGVDGESLVGVEYRGSIRENRVEIGEGETIEANQAGNKVFWAERQEVFAAHDARGFRLAADGAIIVDGQMVELKAGDNVHSIIAKINDSGAAVKAGLDPVNGALTLRTNDAHQLSLEDAQGSSVLRDLGVIRGDGSRPPANYALGSRVSGGSIFDAAMSLRDSLNRGDVIDTGGKSLAAIDAGLTNLERRVAELGSRSERLDMSWQRLNREIPDVQAQLSREEDLDLAEAATTLKMLERSHQASLQTSGRLFPQTLLDFLR